MKRKILKTSRSHKQIHAGGHTDTGIQNALNSMGPCCKLWFPCTETSGTYIDDLAGGVRLTPSTIGFGTSNAVSIDHPQAAPTIGSLPSVSTGQDFILFGVFSSSNSIGRFSARIALVQSSDGALYQIADGDATGVRKAGGTVYYVGSETNIGVAPGGEIGSIAAVRSGDSFGTWMQNQLPAGMNNDYIVNGNIFLRYSNAAARGDGDPQAGPYTGVINKNEYGVDTTNWGDGTLQLSPNPALGYIEDSVPGCWVRIDDPSFPMPIADQIRIGSGISPSHWYGIALFAFADGLPSDFKQALRWMREQWITGNKVLWPGWCTVS